MSAVYLHIGLPKTGTTHLQDRLWRNRDLALSSSGLLYPGNEIADHFHAAAHLQPDRYLDWVDPEFASAWPTMVAQMKAWPQRSLVSHELFATATGAQVDKLMSDLSFADEVHVLVTVRDLGRQLPSVWQENVRISAPRPSANLSTPCAPTHLEPPGAGREEPFWEFQDYVRILRTWAPFVGAERVHVITVPKTRTGDDLWNRFLSVIGVDPAALTIPVPDLNSSLSAAQTEFVRRLNTLLQPDDIEWRRYERVMKGRSSAKSCSPNARPCTAAAGRASAVGGRTQPRDDRRHRGSRLPGGRRSRRSCSRPDGRTNRGADRRRGARRRVGHGGRSRPVGSPAEDPPALADTNGECGAPRTAPGVGRSAKTAVARQNLVSRGVLSRVSRSTVLPSSGFVAPCQVMSAASTTKAAKRTPPRLPSPSPQQPRPRQQNQNPGQTLEARDHPATRDREHVLRRLHRRAVVRKALRRDVRRRR